jgi:hypothetical protein
MRDLLSCAKTTDISGSGTRDPVEEAVLASICPINR